MRRSLLIGSGIVLLGLATALGALHFLSRPSAGHLALQIEVKPAIMSGAYKVYANREAGDGRYWLAKVILRNDGGSPVQSVRTSFQIPGLVGWTTPRTTAEILPGQTVVALFYPHFPDTVASKTTNTTEQVDFRVEYGPAGEVREEVRQAAFQLRARNDLIYTTIPESEVLTPADLYENTDLIAAFVTPDDPVIKYFVQQLEQKVMGGTTVGAGADEEEVVRFMGAVYAFWVANGMVYAGTEGLPEKTATSATMIQHVRLPREVLSGQAGICVELAVLFASIAEAAGLQPLIMTTSGHAWPVIQAGGGLIPIEATAIGRPGMGEKHKPASFEEAIEAGQKNVQAWMAGGSNEIGVTIGAFDTAALHRSGIVPPELPDDPVLRKQIDDTFARLLKNDAPRRGAGAAEAPQREPAPPAPAAGEGRETAPHGEEGAPGYFMKYADPRGYFEVALPGDWQVTPTPYPQAPWYALQAGDPSIGVATEVYVFPGVASVDEALSAIESFVANGGGALRYQPAGTATIGSQKFQHYTGLTTFPARNAAFEWEAFIRVGGGRTTVLSAGAPQGRFASLRPLLRQVVGTFKVGA